MYVMCPSSLQFKMNLPISLCVFQAVCIIFAAGINN